MPHDDDHHADEGGHGASHAAMKAAKLDLAFRDKCAGLLIPLNECRRATASVPWECNDERHAYEKCQYLEYKARVAALNEEKRKGKA